MVRPGTQSAPAVLLMAATITVLGIGTAHAASPANQCESAKNKIAGKYAFCREEAEAKAIKTGAAADYTKCDAAFGQKWAKTEAKGAGMCPTKGDQAALQSLITADTNQWAAALGVGPACSGGGGGGGLLKTGQTQCDQRAGTLGACPGSPAGQDGAVMAGKARCPGIARCRGAGV